MPQEIFRCVGDTGIPDLHRSAATAQH